MKTGLTAVAATALTLAFTGCGGSDWSSTATPSANDALATKLSTRIFQDVQNTNRADLEQFFSPSFQLQRTTGGAVSKASFIANLPNLRSYKFIGPILGVEYNGTLTATYTAQTDLMVDGKQYQSAPNAFLSVFAKGADGQWHVIGHGNFNQPK